MKIVIPGGSGHLGTLLARAFYPQHEVVVLSRRRALRPWRTVAWDGVNLGTWAGEIDGADVVINLAGRSVNCRYTGRTAARSSSRACSRRASSARPSPRAQNPPHLWLQASTATIYAHRSDAANDEDTRHPRRHEPDAPRRGDSASRSATQWERAVDDAKTPRTRKVKLRTAIVMTPDAGTPSPSSSTWSASASAARPATGGSSCRGFITTISSAPFASSSISDFISGVVNIAAPNPLPNADFMRAIRKAWGIPFGIPRGTASARSRRVPPPHRDRTAAQEPARRPGRLTQNGFQFSIRTGRSGARAVRRMARAARTPVRCAARAADVVTYSLRVATAKAEETRERILDAALQPLPPARLRRDDHARYRRRGGRGHGGGVLLLPVEGRAGHGVLRAHGRGGARDHPAARSTRSRDLGKRIRAIIDKQLAAVRRASPADGRAGAHRHRSEASALAVRRRDQRRCATTASTFFARRSSIRSRRCRRISPPICRGCSGCIRWASSSSGCSTNRAASAARARCSTARSTSSCG